MLFLRLTRFLSVPLVSVNIDSLVPFVLEGRYGVTERGIGVEVLLRSTKGRLDFLLRLLL